MVARVAFQNLAELFHRLARLFKLKVHQTQIEQGMEIVGTEPEHLIQIGGRALQVLYLVAQQGAVEQRGLVGRIQLDRIIVIGHRSEEVVEIVTHICAVQVEVVLAGLEFDHPVHILESLLPFALTAQQVGPQQIGVGVERVVRYGLVQIGQCGHGVATQCVETRPGAESVLEPRIHPQQGRQRGIGRRIAFQLRLGNAFVEQDVFVTGIVAQATHIVHYRQRIVPKHLPGEAPQPVCVRAETVPLHRQCGVLLGSLVVLQLQFGQRTVKVWLRQVGFGLDGLIEILDGEHIVIHAQHIAPDVQDLLGVDLCRQPCAAAQQRHGNDASEYYLVQ